MFSERFNFHPNWVEEFLKLDEWNRQIFGAKKKIVGLVGDSDSGVEIVSDFICQTWGCRFPWKLTNIPWNSKVGSDEISFWNGPFLGDMLSFGVYNCDLYIFVALKPRTDGPKNIYLRPMEDFSSASHPLVAPSHLLHPIPQGQWSRWQSPYRAALVVEFCRRLWSGTQQVVKLYETT